MWSLVMASLVTGVSCILSENDVEGTPSSSPSIHSSMKIGVIKNGSNDVRVEKDIIQGCNVTFHWHDVSVIESFQVFSADIACVVEMFIGMAATGELWNEVASTIGPCAVHRSILALERSNVDLIVVFDDDNMYTAYLQSFTTSDPPLILWGERPSYSQKGYGISRNFEQEDVCDVVHAGGTLNDPYCIEDVTSLSKRFNVTVIQEVKLTVPAIMTSLVVKHLKWNVVFIIYENVTETEAGLLVDQLSSKGVLVIMYNIDQIRNLTDVFYHIYTQRVSKGRNIEFLVLCHFGCIKRLFNNANLFDSNMKKKKTLMKQVSRWLVAVYDHEPDVVTTLRACANDIDNIAIVCFPKVKGSDPEKAFLKELQRVMFEYTYESDLLEEIENQTADSNNSLYNFTITKLKKDASSWLSTASCEGIRIDTLMWLGQNQRGFSNVGYITMSGQVSFYAKIFPNMEFGYNKRIFLVSTLHYPPFVIKKEHKNGTAHYDGIAMDLLRELASTLNFTYNITEAPDGKWGSIDPDGSFNGLIGQLEREEVDIVAADISIQKAREMVMDFAFPFYYGDTSVLLKKPDPNARKWRTLIDPFKWEVLAAIGVMLPIASLLAYLVEKFNPFYDHLDKAGKDSPGLRTFVDAFWYMYSALLSQGGVNLPDSTAGRTIVSCWWLFCIVIVGTYCGNLIAFLTITKDKPPFDTLEQMAASTGYKWGTQAGTHWEVVFVNSTNREFRAVGDKMIEFNKTDPQVMATKFDIQLAKVKEGQYGWIGDTVIIEVQMAKDCDLMMIKEKFLPLKYAFGFTNNSPHTKIFSEQMLSIHESGLLQVWKRRWWPKASICSSAKILTEDKPISIVDVQGAFYVAAGGAVLGFFCFVLELVIGNCRKKRRCRLQAEHARRVSGQSDSTEQMNT